MNRRIFLTTVGAAILAPLAVTAARMDYAPGTLEQALDAGQPVVLDFFAPWCGTCQSQKRTIAKLMEANPAYVEKIAYIIVDWDTYKKQPIATDLKIPRRSTLVAISPDRRELGRIVAGTGEAEIKALFDAALGSATS
ncbi:thioredoxin family protein [Maritimibacter sp. DP1N21-5]|uniref:thioredoxin family protein n=1 Tax=Maritimibacter sp. DP1N21-5 TaxID=2836867 RepID=UPI001C47A1E0|nr:thioredoxin family protein [Maritimibacter sp. DP1N21-5]MBV7410911.1 thioredoxin family protein [Maritimibacter sp. DP1N21-5]